MEVAQSVHAHAPMKTTPLRSELTARLQVLLHRYREELARTTRELGPQIEAHVAALRALDVAEPKRRDSSPEIREL
jgi:hypothetical protein